MIHRLSVTLVLIASAFLLPAAAGQGADNVAEPDEATAYHPLRESFRALATSLRQTGGIGDAEREVVRAFTERVAAFVDEWPDYQPARAMQLQLAIWLSDTPQVEALFADLTERQPENIELAEAWLRYLQGQELAARLTEVATELRQRFPNNVAFEIIWIEHLRDEHRYAEALELLEALEYDGEAFPKAVVLHSDALFAEHQFEASVEKLESLSAATRASDFEARQAHAMLLQPRRECIELWNEEQTIRELEASADDLPRVLLVTDRGSIVVELFENDAPNTVANFVSLVESGFYDTTTFHRVERNFMAQGGDPNSKPGSDVEPGTGSPGYRIADEHMNTSFRKHFTGSLAMANTGAPNSGGCQFYINVTPTPHLNGRHTVFGRVVEGLDVARSLRRDDRIISARVLRKREHEYTPETLPDLGPGSTAFPNPDSAEIDG